jgi:uncharacterized RDD family membrane protein YckC
MQNPPPPPPGGYPPQPPPQTAYAPPPGYVYAAPQPNYGGFWIRLIAYVIDAVIVGVPMGIVLGILGALAGGTSVVPFSPDQSSSIAGGFLALLPIFYGLGGLVGAAYFIYFWKDGGTIGMKIFKLRVADAGTGRPIGVGKAVLRAIGFFIAALPCVIGLIWAAFDARKQGWHDKIAGTVVIQG